MRNPGEGCGGCRVYLKTTRDKGLLGAACKGPWELQGWDRKDLELEFHHVRTVGSCKSAGLSFPVCRVQMAWSSPHLSCTHSACRPGREPYRLLSGLPKYVPMFGSWDLLPEVSFRFFSSQTKNWTRQAKYVGRFLHLLMVENKQPLQSKCGPVTSKKEVHSAR